MWCNRRMCNLFKTTAVYKGMMSHTFRRMVIYVIEEEDVTMDNGIKDLKLILFKSQQMTMFCSCGLGVKL